MRTVEHTPSLKILSKSGRKDTICMSAVTHCVIVGRFLVKKLPSPVVPNSEPPQKRSLMAFAK